MTEKSIRAIRCLLYFSTVKPDLLFVPTLALKSTKIFFHLVTWFYLCWGNQTCPESWEDPLNILFIKKISVSFTNNSQNILFTEIYEVFQWKIKIDTAFSATLFLTRVSFRLCRSKAIMVVLVSISRSVSPLVRFNRRRLVSVQPNAYVTMVVYKVR